MFKKKAQSKQIKKSPVKLKSVASKQEVAEKEENIWQLVLDELSAEISTSVQPNYDSFRDEGLLDVICGIEGFVSYFTISKH
jgi:hypothetical protein